MKWLKLKDGGHRPPPQTRLSHKLCATDKIDGWCAVTYTELSCCVMPNILSEIVGSAVALAKGFAVTLKTMFRPTVTENYHEFGHYEDIHFESRYRGLH